MEKPAEGGALMFVNTLKLTRFMLNREKATSTAWVLALTLMSAMFVRLFAFVTPTALDRAQIMTIAENPAVLLISGPLHPHYGPSLTDASVVFNTFMMVLFAVTVGVMNIFLVVRHTRVDEELGRYEVLRSLPCGRLSTINAVMLSVLVINSVMTILLTLSIWISLNIGDSYATFGSALLWGVNMGVIGMLFAAAAALFSQLSATSRGALSYSFMLLAFFYLLRGMADSSPTEMGVLGYISPLGLISRTWVFIENSWLPVFVNVAIAGIFTALAYKICAIRDIDQGLIPARSGKPYGGKLLSSPLGLNFRLLRRSMVVWLIIMFVFMAAAGTALEDVESFVAGNEMYQELMLEHLGLLGYVEGLNEEEILASIQAALATRGMNVTQAYSIFIIRMMALVAAIPMLTFMLKAKAEEKAIRTELIVATATHKTSYLSGFVIITFVLAVLMQIVQAFGLSLMADPEQMPFGVILQYTLSFIPFLWVMGGLTALLVGLLPKYTWLVWAYYGFTFFLLMYGGIFPDWVQRFTPLSWTSGVLAGDIGWSALLVLTVISISLAVLGILCYRKRDINAVTQ